MLLTQTNWLRMPARELGGSFDAPNGVHGVGSTLLKRHKILPHPREERIADFYPSTPATKPRDLVIDTGISSMPSSDTSSPRTLKHASKRIGAPGLPPTPPTHSRQSSSGSHPIIPAPTFDIPPKESAHVPSAPNTPPNQRSPPTPDVTPPRAMPLAFRPPAGDRYPSSRTDSFKTARENPYSSDEDGDGDEVSTVRPVLPSTRPSEVDVPQVPDRSQKRKEVGLGLGLESDNEGTTTPKAQGESSEREFVVFDGEWGSTGGEVSEVEREWDDNLMRNVTVRKRPARGLHILTDGAADDVLENNIVSPTNATRVARSLPLQERIARHRRERDAADRTSTEKFAERIAWPAAVRDPESPSTPDVRRFSAMSRSTNSTVIEAMVVDAPPMRRKTLRHTKKHLGLREFSSDQSTVGSGPNSVISNEPHHRLVHATARIPERRHRSLASNGTMSTTSSSGRSRRDVFKNGGIPVVVIPDRRSSTKSSRAPSLRSTSSRKTKRSMSLNSAPLSQSSKYNDPGYFDSLPPRKRTMSESAGSGHSVRTIDFPPDIPARRSSLSAPTSRNTSRAGSLTAESLKAHNLIQARKLDGPKPEPEQVQPFAESQKESGSQSARLNVDHNGDPFFGNRLSTQVTPFSQASYETAGTAAEVSEAQAVTIFPHQNKSVLVVQQRAPSEPSPPALTAIDTSQPTMAVNGKATVGPVTPPQPTHPMDEVDSPLRNPRAPPDPPAIKFIPPTPAGLTPSQEEDRQLGHNLDDRPATSDSKPKRGMSLMRRAFSNRRNSESAVPPPVGLLKRTFSLSSRRKDLTDEATQTSKGNANPSTLYPSVADRPADGSKLHPFWRPAHFWDDLEDHESVDDDEFGGYPIIDNRPGPPKRGLSGKLKRTFAILPITDDFEYQPHAADRRTVKRTGSGNMRVVKQRSDSSLRREADRRRYEEAPVGSGEGAFGYGFKDGNGGNRIHTIPGLGLRVEYVGWSGMRRRFSERRREQRSEKLRASISSPRGVQSGVDDVLRRRSQV